MGQKMTSDLGVELNISMYKIKWWSLIREDIDSFEVQQFRQKFGSFGLRLNPVSTTEILTIPHQTEMIIKNETIDKSSILIMFSSDWPNHGCPSKNNYVWITIF